VRSESLTPSAIACREEVRLSLGGGSLVLQLSPAIAVERDQELGRSRSVIAEGDSVHVAHETIAVVVPAVRRFALVDVEAIREDGRVHTGVPDRQHHGRELRVGPQRHRA
jgi:hypothetical protein